MIYSSAESTPFLSPIGLNERTFQAHRNGSKMRAQSRTHLAELFVSQKEMKASIEAIQFRTEARRERFARKVVEAAYCVASHREDRKCSFEAPIINISLPGWQSQWTNF